MVRGLRASGINGYTIRDQPYEYKQAYYKKNKAVMQSRQKQRYLANPAKYKAISRAYYYKNKEAKKQAEMSNIIITK
jgi:hypothetical protein